MSEPCKPCAKRARKALDYVDRKGWKLPKVVRNHFERTAAAFEQRHGRKPRRNL